jgi:hypothetical protein
MTKKVKIERKPMKVKRTRKISEEQREALRERMKNMRKKRKPAEYKNVNERVLTLPDDDTYSFKNVKGWIKHNKEMVVALGKQGRGRHVGEKEQRRAESQAASRKAYIRYCEYYLKTGDWIGIFSGQDEEHKVVPRCVVMAYYPDGTPKRSVGVFYPDIGAVWTSGMDESEYGTYENREYIKTETMALTDRQFTGDM